MPQIAFGSAPNPLHLPADLCFGKASGVAVNAQGHVFAFSRANTSGPVYAAAAQLLEFAPDGQFIREIGHNLYAWSFAHAVRIDSEDNIRVTDIGSDLLVKFDHDGRVAMVFGRKQEASVEDAAPLKHPKLPPVDGLLRQVADIARDSAGNACISNGCINSRIARGQP